MINMIKSGFAVLAMLVVLGLTACKKDSPENQDEVVDSIDLYELLKNNDLAAVIDWTYSKDADIDHALLVSKTSAEYSRDDLSLSINENSKKKIDELKKEEKTQTSDGYLDLGIDSKEQKEMSEIKSILNRAFELYGKQNAVLAALVREKHFYDNDRDDKKSLITKLILIEKGLMHD